MALDVSIIVCTRDRPQQLGEMLDGAARLAIPAGLRWELLVVDNGSDDAAATVAEAFASRLPIRRISEPKPGLANARNAGMRAAQGDLLCWTDDDVALPADWLVVYWEASRAFPADAVFGGRIVPVAEAPATPWFAAGMEQWPLSSVVGHRDLAPSRIALQPRGNLMPWGANYAIRAADQRAFPYDGTLLFGEETDVIFRLLTSGRSGRWLPESRVMHRIPAARQSRRYVADYFRRHGRAAAYFWSRDGVGNPVAAGAPSWCDRPDWAVRAARRLSRVAAEGARRAGGPGSGLKWLARAAYLDGVLDFRGGPAPAPAPGGAPGGAPG